MPDEFSYEVTTTRPETVAREAQAKVDVEQELAYREWNLARWSVGLTALVGLGAIVAAAVSGSRV